MQFALHFVGVGPQRTGTTWLDKFLRHHSQLCLPEDVKETRFFDLYYDKGIEWYASHFSVQKQAKLFGEIAPTYFNDLSIPRRVHALSPNAKVIVNLRDPVSRVFSLYRHHIFRGHANGSFRDVISSNPHLIDSGKYAKYIPKWLDVFGEGVKFIVFDDIVTSPAETLERVWRFLGVSETTIPGAVTEKEGAISPPRSLLLAKASVKVTNILRGYRLHKIVEVLKMAGLNKLVLRGGKEDLPELTPDEKSWVLEKHEPDIRYVELLLGRDLTRWRQV